MTRHYADIYPEDFSWSVVPSGVELERLQMCERILLGILPTVDDTEEFEVPQRRAKRESV